MYVGIIIIIIQIFITRNISTQMVLKALTMSYIIYLDTISLTLHYTWLKMILVKVGHFILKFSGWP